MGSRQLDSQQFGRQRQQFFRQTNRAMRPLVVAVLACVLTSHAKKAKEGEKPDWAKKDVRDFNDHDLQRLLDQWDEDEEPIPPDELPEGHPPPRRGRQSCCLPRSTSLLISTRRRKSPVCGTRGSTTPIYTGRGSWWRTGGSCSPSRMAATPGRPRISS